MTTNYTDEKNVQIVISLLKQHGVKKVIASPGATNITFVASIQNDPWFEIYSAVDERSAAYIACGLAEESSEPVVISCTGATSSRNYMPGLTEAFYRKLPVIAITSSQVTSKLGHHFAQMTDRSSPPSDVVKYSTTISVIKDADDLWNCEIKANTAILECKRAGGGPVHINLETTQSPSFTVETLPSFRKIERYTIFDSLPLLPKGKIAIFIGSHTSMSIKQTSAIDTFCKANNAVVFCDRTSGYNGEYAINFSIVAAQQNLNKTNFYPHLMLHIGEVSGDYYNLSIKPQCVWRISPDGEVRDTFKCLRSVFEMPIESFFESYSKNDIDTTSSYFNDCRDAIEECMSNFPDIPFSNIWIASQLAPKLPEHSIIHFGILNSLRAWNFFKLPNTVSSMSNVGGFGIDGGISSLVGASIYHKNKICFIVVGDLAFFYDINVVGNRHISNNVRILLVNNGKGAEFRRYDHFASQFGEDTDKYIAAAGHWGNQSPNLVKNYAVNLGYKYLSASNKDEFNDVYEDFITSEHINQPIIFEVFTNSLDESQALESTRTILSDLGGGLKSAAKKIMGNKSISMLKSILNK